LKTLETIELKQREVYPQMPKKNTKMPDIRQLQGLRQAQPRGWIVKLLYGLPFPF
jgi:hypothetical protein